MLKFILNFGAKIDGKYQMDKVEVELPDLETAHKEAREYAEDMYMQNPIRDVNEIMKEGVDEDTANILFKLDMLQNTSYFAERKYD